MQATIGVTTDCNPMCGWELPCNVLINKHINDAEQEGFSEDQMLKQMRC